MKNLIIGDTSQLSYYFPSDYDRISSRNIDYKSLYDMHFDRVYVCFADQRTFIQDNEKGFLDINYDYTLEVINFFKGISEKVIVYSTCELWNNIEGAINLEIPFNYNYSPYIKSKEVMSNYILSHRNYFSNVIIIYPFNFNSPYRKGGFLFGKIFDSLINKRKIEIGDTNFYRDLIHPKLIVDRSIKTNKDEIVGSGCLINVNKFIRDLYKEMEMEYDDFVTENISNNLIVKRKEYYYDTKNKYSYETLLKETINDIKQWKKKE